MKPSAIVVGVLVLIGVMFTTAHFVRRPSTSASAAIVAAGAMRSAVDASEAAMPLRTSAPAPRAKSRLVVAFRLDPDLTRGLYLGDRWVSPPSFNFAQPGDRYVVHARMQAVGADGERTDVSGDWSTSDADMVGITRGDGGEVVIDVDKAGTAELRVAAGGETKVLQVLARRVDDGMEVDFRQ
jgi:hypothetical protein